MENTHRLKLPYIIAAQAQKHVTHNEALRQLDAVVQLSVKEVDRNDMPEAPEEGDRYIIGNAPTGDWSAYPDQLASYQDGFWAHFEPQEGWHCWVESSANFVVFTDGTWVAQANGGAGVETSEIWGVNTTADTTNRLSVKSDAVLLSHDDVTPGSGDLRLNLNKATAAETSSIVFQTNYSGRAELGLAGNDALSFRVSGDGATWKTGFAVDPQTGATCFGPTVEFSQALNLTGSSPIMRISNLAETVSGIEIVDAQESASQHLKLLYDCSGGFSDFELNGTQVARFANSGLTLNQNLDVSNICAAGYFVARNRAMIMNNYAGTMSNPTTATNLDHIWNNDSGNVWHFCSDTTYRATGNAVVRAASFETTSDYRLKENITPLQSLSAVARLQALKPIGFEWRDVANMKCAQSSEGFLAHELAEAVPSAVTGEKDAVEEDGKTPIFQSADYSQVIPLIVAALQGALEKITHLEDQLLAKG